MLTGPIVVFLPNFYATEAGLSLAVVGGIFFVARIWDGAADLLIGMASDATRTRWGSRKPWMLAATPVLCVSVFFLLMPPTGVGPLHLFLGLLAVYAAWSAFQIPYMAWGAAISSDFADRGRIFGLRELATILGSFCTIFLPYAFTGVVSPPLADVLRIVGLAIVAVMVVSTPLCLLFAPPARVEVPRTMPMLSALFSIRKNVPFMRLLLVNLLATTALLIFTAGVLFYINNVLGLQSEFLQLLLIQQLATLLSVPVVIGAAHRFGRHRVLAAGCLGAALGFVALSTVPSGAFFAAAGVLVIIGCSAGALFVLTPALAADAIDYGAVRRIGAQGGLYMSTFSLVAKFGTALAVGIALPLLQVMGFDPTSALTSEGKQSLQAVCLFLPAAMCVVTGVVAWSHPIDRRRHDLIVKRLTLMSGRTPRLT